MEPKVCFGLVWFGRNCVLKTGFQENKPKHSKWRKCTTHIYTIHGQMYVLLAPYMESHNIHVNILSHNIDRTKFGRNNVNCTTYSILPRPFLQIFTQRLLLIRFFILWPYFLCNFVPLTYLPNSWQIRFQWAGSRSIVFVFSFTSSTRKALLHYISTNLLFSALCLQRPCTKHFCTIHRNFFLVQQHSLLALLLVLFLLLTSALFGQLLKRV